MRVTQEPPAHTGRIRTDPPFGGGAPPGRLPAKESMKAKRPSVKIAKLEDVHGLYINGELVAQADNFNPWYILRILEDRGLIDMESLDFSGTRFEQTWMRPNFPERWEDVPPFQPTKMTKGAE